MPKRWLSRRGRPQNNDASAHPTSNNGPDFDFAFSNSPLGAPTTLPVFTAPPANAANDGRPTTAGGIVEGRTRKKLKIEVPRIRPKSSEGNRVSTIQRSHRASRSVDDLIGLAFGSPSHPPMAFGSLAAPLSPVRPEHGDRTRRLFVTSGKGSHLQPTKWKKIGALFRSGLARGKDATHAGSSPSRADDSQKHNDRSQKNTEPNANAVAPAQPTRCPPPVPAGIEPRPITNVPCQGKSVLLEPSPPSSAELPPRRLAERPIRMSSLPKLEVEIPNKPLDRYTVIMSNIPAASRSSSLLARRTRAVDGLSTSTDSSRNASTSTTEPTIHEEKVDEAGGEILLARRMTSPTLPKPPFTVTKSEASPSPTTSKYSLFPPKAPAPIKIVGRVPFESPLKRSATSPARLSPMQEQFPIAKPQPLSSRRNVPDENVVSSPEDKTASTDRTDPWSTNHSLQSSVSSSTTMEEIFFDIKSFRDSKGIEDTQQFVINRPDSTVVHLARTRSKLNAASRTHKQGSEPAPSGSKPTLSSLRNELVDKHASVNTVNTAVFDEVIAAVEEFATPTSSKQNPSQPLTGNTLQSSAHKATLSKTDLDMKLLPPDPVLPARTASVSRRDQVSRNIPSPVAEEVSPLSKKSTEKGLGVRSVSPLSFVADEFHTSPASIAPQSAISYNSPIKSKDAKSKIEDSSKLKELSKPVPFFRVDTPIEDSPTIPQGPPPRKPVPVSHDDKPPPVPEKDSKFIPISKFAAKNTMSKVEQAVLRPARPIRSATDTVVGSSPRLQQKQYSPKITGRAERSATLPMPQGQRSSRTSPQPNKSDFAHRKQVHAVGKDEPQPVAAVLHAAPTAEVSVARTVSLSRKQSSKVLVPGPKLAARRAAERNKENGSTDSGTDTPDTVLSAANSPAIGTDSPRIPQEQMKPKVVDVQPREVTIRPNPLRSHPSPPSVVITDLPVVLSTAGTATPAPTRSPPEDPVKEKAREKIKALKEQAREKIANDAEKAEKKRASADSEVVRDREKEKRIIEEYKEKDKRKWEIMEKRALSPVMTEGDRRYGHKQGLSVGIVLESA